VLNRRLASLLAAVTVAGLAATGCAEQSAAIRVDDATVSRGDFEDQLDLFYSNDDLRGFLFQGVTRDQLRAEGDPRGSYTQEYVGSLAAVQVQFLVVAQALEDEGIDLSDADRDAVIDQLDQGLPGGYDSLPSGVREDLVEGFAGFDKLRSELGEEEFNVALGKVIDEATIEVSSRYGSWDPDQFTVTPPEGPEPAPGTADAGPELTPG
jgi:hypothetical protein